MIPLQGTVARLLLVILMTSSLPLSGQSQDQDDDREGGIMGTGIVGTITDLGSILVNGQKITFAPDQTATGPLGPMPASALRRGDTVAAFVKPDNETWRAVTIQRVFPIIGPVSHRTEDRLVVMGTRIDAGNATGGSTEADPGDWVAVSGLWRDGEIVASRIEVVPMQPAAHVTGSYLSADPSGGLTVGGTKILDIVPRHIGEGTVILVEGTPTANGMRATRIETGLFAQTPGILLAEGYLSAPGPSGLYTLLGSGLVAYTDRPNMIDIAAPMVRCGFGGDLYTPGSDIEPPVRRTMLARLGC